MVSLDLDFVHQFVYENLLKPSVSADGFNFTARCPVCGDSKKSQSKRRFHLKYEHNGSIYWNCFNCGQSGTFIDLYAHMKGISPLAAYKELRKFDPKKIRQQLNKKKRIDLTEKKVIEKQNFNWILKDCVGESTETKNLTQRNLQRILKKFKESRKITFPVFVAYKGDYKNRIIIPIVEDGQIIYFQGRAINDSITPKYLNPKAEKEHIIQNETKFDKNKFIIVTEGILDGDAIENNQGTAALGANVPDDLIEKLMKKTSKGVIIAVDNPKIDETGYKKLQKILKHSKFKNNLKFFLFPNKYNKIKDLNELKTATSVEDVYKFVTTNSHNAFQTQIKLKTMSWRK